MIIIFYVILLLSLSHSMYAEQRIQIDVPTKRQTMMVKQGELFSINLSSNPSTGYTNVINKIDPSFVQEVKKEYKPRKTKPGLVGASGIDTFTFKAIKAGETKIIIDYVRPWEPLQPARQNTYVITIQ